MRKVSVGLDVVLCVLMAGMVGPPAVRFFVTSTIETSYARHVNTLLLLVGVGAVIMRVVLGRQCGAGRVNGRRFVEERSALCWCLRFWLLRFCRGSMRYTACGVRPRGAG